MLHSGAFDTLQRFVLDLNHFKSLFQTRRFDLHVYWRAIGGGALPKDIGDQYMSAIDRHKRVLLREVRMIST